MTQRAAHDVDIYRAEALLHRGGPRPRRTLITHEERLKRHHAGDGEQDRRVMGDETGRGNGRVSPINEELGERLAEVVGVERRGGGHDRKLYLPR